jgi:hypothetical protein
MVPVAAPPLQYVRDDIGGSLGNPYAKSCQAESKDTWCGAAPTEKQAGV